MKKKKITQVFERALYMFNHNFINKQNKYFIIVDLLTIT